MSKQALLLLVDVGHSMDEPFSQDASKAKIALECCKLTLQQKIFNNSSHELGLVLFGDNESDDGDSLLLQGLQKPTVELVRKVEQLSQAKFDNTRAGGDIFSAINRSLNLLNDHVKKKKFNKRMFVFTNGMGPTSFTSEDLLDLAQKLLQFQIKLNVVPIDFMTTYNLAQNKIDHQMMDSPQEENCKLLIELKNLAQDYVQIFPASLAIELYKRFRKKDTSPVARFKGFLELGPGLEIEIATYKAVRRQKLKSLARFDSSVPFEPLLSRQKEVIVETNYVLQGDQSGKLVDKENIINAYYYGPQLVPISPILEAGSKILEDKNFRLLGFIDKAKVPRHAFMGDIDIVVPSTDNLVGRKLFTSFIYSMLSLQKYGLARYIPRNAKNGVTPKMMVLIPYRSAEREHFYLVQLPTVEDVRQYPFRPLKQSTSEQKEMVKNLVQKMMLFNKDGDQEVKVQNTFNPMRQYFYQSIFHRALNDSEELPPLDPVIHNYITPELSKQKETLSIMTKLRKSFPLVKKHISADNAEKKKKTVIWKEVIQEMNTHQETLVKEEEAVKPKFSFEDEEHQIKFNPTQPVLSFRRMVSYNKEDLVGKALYEMKKYITGKLPFTVTDQAYRQLTYCALELRKACINEQEDDYWDEWFLEMRRDHTAFHNEMKKDGLGFIKGDNLDMFKVVEVHNQQLDQDLFELD